MMTTAHEITWSDLRRAVSALGESRGEWAGYPMPIEGLRLVVEPRHPLPNLDGAWLGPRDEFDKAREARRVAPADFTLRNHWRSLSRQLDVWITQESDGQITHSTLPFKIFPGGRLLDLFAVAQGAWSAEAELQAQMKLIELTTDTAWQYYVLLGMFLETSPRSGVSYLFRKSAPTLALKAGSTGEMRILAALCLHPIGYYEGTRAGVMVPTDDVIAHLLMMRGDEHKFWAKANQHAACFPEAYVA